MNTHKALLLLVVAFLILSAIVLTFVFLPGGEPAPSRVTPEVADSGAPDEEAVEPPPVEDAPGKDEAGEPVEETPVVVAETPSDETDEADETAERPGDVAEEYGERIMSRYGYSGASKKKIKDIVNKLVWEYPSHTFVIDLEEAQSLGLNVEMLDETRSDLCSELLSSVKGCFGFVPNTPKVAKPAPKSKSPKSKVKKGGK